MSAFAILTISTAAAALAASSVAVVQVGYPAADIDYVYTGAVRMGLTRLSSPKRTFTAADYAVLPAALTTVTVSVATDNDATAQAIATALGVSKARVLSKALCTGLTTLNGTDAEDGPYG
jgi:hypothetical protein